MSHEIRTPLTAIVGFAQSLRDDPSLDKSHAGALATITHNSEHLTRIIDDILDLSKIETNKIELERMSVPLIPLIKDIEQLMGGQAEDAGLSFTVEFEFPLPDHLVTDPTRLKQILLNLCSNAIKFTDEGGIVLRIAYREGAGELVFSVIDSGIGIPEENQARIFSAFTQADASTTRRFGGTGLGLYISKQLVDRLGGSLTIQSESGVGSRLDVFIPLGDYPTTEFVDVSSYQSMNVQPTRQRLAAPQLQGHILLVEDSLDIQQLVSLFVGKTGVALSLANNGEEALEKVSCNMEFNLVLMDVQMPVMDGLQATRLLREMGYAGPIVALTANVMKEDRERCLTAGCTEFLPKPIDQNSLYQVLARYLRPVPDQQSVKVMSIPKGIDTRLHDLVNQFVESLPERVAAITETFENQDWEQVRMLVHQLKGLAGSMGFPQLTEKAAEMEQLLVDKLHDEFAMMLTELQSMSLEASEDYPVFQQKN